MILTPETLLFIGAMLAAGALAGFVAGLFGIGGGFVVVPALASVLTILSAGSDAIAPDKIMHVAIGTSLATIIFTSMRSVQAHAKRGAVDFEILRSWTPWVVIGVVLGLLVAQYLDGHALKVTFGVGVFIMSWHFLFPVLTRRGPVATEMPKGLMRGGLGSVLGGYCTLLGIGGGTPAVLIMTLSGQPMHRAVATAAGFGTIIAVPGTIGSIIAGFGQTGLPFGSLGYVNVIAALAITSMSVITAPWGVTVAHHLNAAHLRRALGLYLLVTSSIMLVSAFSPPPRSATPFNVETAPAVSTMSADISVQNLEQDHGI
ncbi:sulfite exporter TauE/SafE family protein [Hyphomonas sp. NPDC076900]|uniref:sulfite exporter TauE/SafE family protein n=1 Tax=unclassified Hyphomonas TaxID=2630699 RepID=UPI003D04D7CF